MLSQTEISRPCEFIRDYILEEFNLTEKQLASFLGLPEPMIHQLLNNHARITADIALRLSQFTKTSPELWLNLQNRSDLWDVQQKTEMSEITKILPFSSLNVQSTLQNSLVGHHNG
jgi:addiction module HigA family antidote